MPVFLAMRAKMRAEFERRRRDTARPRCRRDTILGADRAATALLVFYAYAKVTMASFKASHPKRHGLTLARTGGERRSLDVRTHLKGPWRCVVKKNLTFRLVPVRR